jgi:hypothetical protein
MNILFISYEEPSLCEGNIRSVAMIRALADAGHRVDLVAPDGTLSDHPNIQVLVGAGKHNLSRARLRSAAFRAVWRGKYDVIHAVDYAVFWAYRLCQLKKIRLVYDAERRFTGPIRSGNFFLIKLFPTHFQRLEAAVLAKAGMILSSCSVLTEDLFSMNKQAAVIQLEDIPMQPLCARKDEEKSDLLRRFGKRLSSVVVCSMLPGNSVGYRNLLIAARKVVDATPEVAFFFKGVPPEQTQSMAASLDIAEHCIFLSGDDSETFLSALNVADAVLFVPQSNGRYIKAQVYTLLQAPGPLVAIHDAAYDEILTDQTAMRVFGSSDAIAEGVLRSIKEPLFSLSIAIEGQQLVTARHTYSSFKHKVRMAYNHLFKSE